MSSSDPDSKIDVLDNPDAVKRKLKKAHAVPKVTDDNGILSFVEYVLLPASYLKYGEPKFVVERRDAEPLVYKTIAEMKKDYAKDVLSPQDLKPAVTAALNTLLEPVQAEFQATPAWQEIEQKAYPPPPAEVRSSMYDLNVRHTLISYMHLCRRRRKRRRRIRVRSTLVRRSRLRRSQMGMSRVRIRRLWMLGRRVGRRRLMG